MDFWGALAKYSIKKARGLASARPFNWLTNWAWYNPELVLDGQYNPRVAEGISPVLATINTLSSAIEEIPLRLYTGTRKNLREIEEHPILNIFERPNEQHTYSNFLWHNILNIIVNGDCIITLTDNQRGMQVAPWDREYLSLPTRPGERPTYRFQTLNEGIFEIPHNKIAHLLWQPAGNNAYLGRSPLQAVWAEILLYKYALEATGGRLQSPVPGIIFEPRDVDPPAIPEADKLDLDKQISRFRGMGAGGAFMGEARYIMKELKGVAHQFNYEVIYTLCQAQIASVLGIPAPVAGTYVGLKQTRVGATFAVEEKIAYKQGIIPLAKKLQQGWTHHLLPILGYKSRDLWLEYDFSVLDFEDEEEKMKRTERIQAWKAEGWIDDAKAKEILKIK